MRIVLLSDTHSQHEKIDVPDGDILIHAGDATFSGSYDEVYAFFTWFKYLPHRNKVFVAGNHDWLFQNNRQLARALTEGIIYLEDDWRMVEGFKIYGSPWQPEFRNWAFNLPRDGFLLEAAWKRIPTDTDILVTHGPPYGILDVTCGDSTNQGCEKLRMRVDQIAPMLHVFGHIHEGYGILGHGILEAGKPIFVNASICTIQYEPTNKPIVIEWTEGVGPQIAKEE